MDISELRTVEDWQHYYAVRVNRLRKLLELNAPAVIIAEECRLTWQTHEKLKTFRNSR